MSLRLRHLIALYHLDRERLGLLSEQATLHDKVREAETVAELAATRQILAKRLKDERALVSDLAWELEEIERRLYGLLAEGTHDPLVVAEVGILRKQQHQIEDQVLQHMEAVEQAEREQQTVEAEWLRRNTRWQEQSGGIQASMEQTATHLAALNSQRQEHLAALLPGDQAAYRQADERHPADALALALDETCPVCTTPLPEAMGDEIVRCPTCRRVVLLEKTESSTE